MRGRFSGFRYLWLVHPIKLTLEAFMLNNGKWTLQAKLSGDDIVCLEPFDSIPIGLNELIGQKQ